MCYVNALFAVFVFTLFQGLCFAQSPSSPCILRQELTSRGPGIVDKIFVAEGQEVKKGEKLLELDSRMLRAGVKEATAVVDAAKANQELATDAFQRVQKLEAGESVTESQKVESRIRLAQAKAALKQAEAALERIKIQLDDATIRAEIAGRARGVPTAIGLAVQVGQSLGRIEAPANSCVTPTPKTN